MNKQLLKLAADLLDGYSDELSNHGCNDYEMKNTPKNQELMTLLDPTNEMNTDFNRKKIFTYDWFLARRCAVLFREESEKKSE